ncbi:D-Ala-D-Ala carboxypeptidase family metallohydrolase [Gloeocapsopsis sp. IPPAS B-1203]|uniref:D-Ala-D-Ala carboxypeptidase family metallohydrolase n=1 Tax=Gloeocapsopsis sp. IPPAS B-1203 TaxID=2049454 RepID=UPI000C184D72|nr:D-Ala-D-Ala carboxypeptidase family metallohydrolase [Gloeocapsopsis sp. IPPAS B-1203]
MSQLNTTLTLDSLVQNRVLVTEIQYLLSVGGFYKGKVDGILGKQTIAAFVEFKKQAYLQHPDRLGQSTARALLELQGKAWHPNPTETSPNRISTVQFRLPTGEMVATNEPIFECKHFTWGEATGNGSRKLADKTILFNVVRTAQCLERVRSHFGNRAIKINSWYRPPSINRAVGGVSNSTHIQGYAVDFTIEGITPVEVYQKLDAWHGKAGGLGKSVLFTHLDLRGYAARWIYGR